MLNSFVIQRDDHWIESLSSWDRLWLKVLQIFRDARALLLLLWEALHYWAWFRSAHLIWFALLGEVLVKFHYHVELWDVMDLYPFVAWRLKKLLHLFIVFMVSLNLKRSHFSGIFTSIELFNLLDVEKIVVHWGINVVCLLGVVGFYQSAVPWDWVVSYCDLIPRGWFWIFKIHGIGLWKELFLVRGCVFVLCQGCVKLRSFIELLCKLLIAHVSIFLPFLSHLGVSVFRESHGGSTSLLHNHF